MTEQELMLTSILNCRRIDLFIDAKPLTNEQLMLYQSMQDRFQKGEPLQYVIGSCNFLGLELLVNPSVLIPRPETEILVDIIINLTKLNSLNQSINVLDLGTGSGNISIALAHFIPNSKITSVDVSMAALQTAQKNARSNAVDGKITFVESDMVTFLNNQKDKFFDVIVSNPPYIKSADLETLPLDVQQEPKLALDGGADGLRFYREIIAQAIKCLVKNALLCFEIGDGQASRVKEILQQTQQFLSIDIYKDYVNTERFVIARKN